jgi:hypothetical protein
MTETEKLKQLEAAARRQAALTKDVRVKSALIEIAEEYRALAERMERQQASAVKR